MDNLYGTDMKWNYKRDVFNNSGNKRIRIMVPLGYYSKAPMHYVYEQWRTRDCIKRINQSELYSCLVDGVCMSFDYKDFDEWFNATCEL